MFETLWNKAPNGAEAAMQHAVQSLVQAGKAPIMIGSIAAMALLGLVTGMGLTHKGRGKAKAKVVPARNGARRKSRKMKTTAH